MEEGFVTPRAKKHRISDLASEDIEYFEDAKEKTKGNWVPVEQTWKPISTFSLWEDDDLQQMVNVAILIPSGIDIEKDVKVTVSRCQKQLQVRAKWPPMLTDNMRLHKVHAKEYGAALPRWWNSLLHGFDRCLQLFNAETPSEIVSVGLVDLPKKVQPKIAEHRLLGEKNGTRIYYVVLIALAQKTKVKNVVSKLELAD